METEKKTNQRTKLSIYILDTIESESTTRFKNRSSDCMMTSDWLVDVSDDRYTTTRYQPIPRSIIVLFHENVLLLSTNIRPIFWAFFHDSAEKQMLNTISLVIEQRKNEFDRIAKVWFYPIYFYFKPIIFQAKLQTCNKLFYPFWHTLLVLTCTDIL
jgi:hypothetical protein